MSRIIYLVMQHDYDDVEFDKAFFSKREAEARCKELNPPDRTWREFHTERNNNLEKVKNLGYWKLYAPNRSFEEYLEENTAIDQPWFIQEIDLVE